MKPIHAIAFFLSACGGELPGAERAPSTTPTPFAPASPARGEKASVSAGKDPATPTSTPHAAPPQTARLEAMEPTAGIVEVKREGPVRTQTTLRAADHPGHERVVFEFEEAVPGYRLEYIDSPVRDCGAGHVVDLPGDGWLSVRLYPARAHDDAGHPTIAARQLEPRLDVVLEIERTCDFEGIVTWVIGTASPNRFRVFELTDPPRLVVDILDR